MCQKLGTSANGQTWPSTQRSSTAAVLASSRKGDSYAGTFADYIASDGGALTAKQLSEVLSISAVTTFTCKALYAPVLSCRQRCTILPVYDRCLVADAWRLGSCPIRSILGKSIDRFDPPVRPGDFFRVCIGSLDSRWSQSPSYQITRPESSNFALRQ